MEGDLTWGGEHTVQYTDDVLQNCTPETYIILLNNVTTINSIKKVKKSKKIKEDSEAGIFSSFFLLNLFTLLTQPPADSCESVFCIYESVSTVSLFCSLDSTCK